MTCALVVGTTVAPTAVAPSASGSTQVGDDHGRQGASPIGNPSSSSSIVEGATLSDTTIDAVQTAPAVAGLILDVGHAVRGAGAVPAPPVAIGTEVEAIEAFVGS